MLLAADSLVYDFDGESVSAVGGVQIVYGGYRLVSRNVTFNRKTGRMLASGNVELIEPGGNRIYADEIDVTDNFSDGFVNALRLETTENTRFAAARAERANGNMTVFEKGVYTACEPCAEKPDKPVTWQVKAETIIWNQQRKTIRFEGARFELFGFPLASLPSFEIADHTVTRKTGFLIPSAGYKSDLGAYAKIPFFWAIAPNMDALLETRAYSRQGVFVSGTFTHQLNNGAYSITAAGISQQNPSVFTTAQDSGNVERGLIGSKGAFRINPRWSFGWNVLAQSDNNFARTYDVAGYNDYRRASEIYLTGLSGRNYFDLRASRFEIQDGANPGAQKQQALVLPALDYRHTFDEAVLGGEFTISANGRNIDRSQDDITGTSVRGLAGQNGRMTLAAGWQRTMIAPGGLAITALAGLRGGAFYTDYDNAGFIGLQPVSYDVPDSFFRGMATAGLDIRYPVLFTGTGSSHVFEPRVQILARPDAAGQATLGLPNEDSQSLVFDAASLFDTDKFSGLDRVEGGVRANAGLRYSGTWDNGLRADALFGQSFHLSGDNPYAAPDLAYAGAFSGLETDTSDFVTSASLGYTVPQGSDAVFTSWMLGAGGRFDEKTFAMRRADVELTAASAVASVGVRYSFIDEQPNYGFSSDREEVKTSASVKFAEHWTANAAATFNLSADKLASYGVGLRYDDECFTYGMSFNESRNVISGERTRTIGVNFSLRTIGDFGNNFTAN
ncbi:MAG: LPS-assembly protein LptD [Phyllobacteriaceae bacterium]|nr:LPS-assembly protein LptD [Phyllobacteriaceae bacterium]